MVMICEEGRARYKQTCLFLPTIACLLGHLFVNDQIGECAWQNVAKLQIAKCFEAQRFFGKRKASQKMLENEEADSAGFQPSDFSAWLFRSWHFEIPGLLPKRVFGPNVVLLEGKELTYFTYLCRRNKPEMAVIP
jgi:hypothetical protein